MNDDIPRMEVDLASVENRSSFHFEKSFDIPTPEGGAAEVAAIATIDVVKSGAGFDLAVRATADVRVECHRCLSAFHMPLSVAFNLVLHRGERPARAPESVEEEDVVEIPMTGEGLYDVFPRVREALILEIPIKLLCREDCKGVCRACGANLNEGACACPPGSGDPRWGTLKKLLNGEDKT